MRFCLRCLYPLATLATIAGLALALPPAQSSEAAADQRLPPPLTSYKGRSIAQTMSYHGAPWLIRQERGSSGEVPGKFDSNFHAGFKLHRIQAPVSSRKSLAARSLE